MIKKKIILFLIIVVSYMIGFCIGCSWIFKRKYELEEKQCSRVDKLQRIILIVDRWLEMREYEKEMSSYFKKMNYKNIAIYGAGYLGKHLIKELSQTEIHIDYIIDKNVEEVDETIIIYKPWDFLPETDAIVVTAVADFDKILHELSYSVNCPILSLEDIIFDI